MYLGALLQKKVNESLIKNIDGDSSFLVLFLQSKKITKNVVPD